MRQIHFAKFGKQISENTFAKYTFAQKATKKYKFKILTNEQYKKKKRKKKTILKRSKM